SEKFCVLVTTATVRRANQFHFPAKRRVLARHRAPRSRSLADPWPSCLLSSIGEWPPKRRCVDPGCPIRIRNIMEYFLVGGAAYQIRLLGKHFVTSQRGFSGGLGLVS